MSIQSRLAKIERIQRTEWEAAWRRYRDLASAELACIPDAHLERIAEASEEEGSALEREAGRLASEVAGLEYTHELAEAWSGASRAIAWDVLPDLIELDVSDLSLMPEGLPLAPPVTDDSRRRLLDMQGEGGTTGVAASMVLFAIAEQRALRRYMETLV